MTEWIFLCNANAYDIRTAFNKLDTIDWKQSKDVEVGDVVYIYVTSPVKAIEYKCEVIKVNMPEAVIDDSDFQIDNSSYKGYGRYMRLHLLEKLDDVRLGYYYLKNNGLKVIQGPSKVSSELSVYLKEIIAKKSLQDIRDEEYPKDYITELGISINQWVELLRNSNVFREEDIELLKRFYLSDNHATTCYDLGIQDGVEHSSFISPIVSLAKRVSEVLDLEPILRDNGKRVWWRIPFWGRYRDDHRFEWKLRPELANAMALLYPELRISMNVLAENKEDNSLVEELKNANVDNIGVISYSGTPKEKSLPIYIEGRKTYHRDRQISLNALALAKYACEIDITHPTFVRKKSNNKYTEPHHLIPMAFSDEFNVSLDVEENIVSLCSNCHNQIHYGKDADVLLCKLYCERKSLLESVGLSITIERLLEMYGYV